MVKHKRLGEILVESGAITQEQCDEALAISKENNKVLGTTLVELGYIDEKTLYKGLEYLFRTPYIDLSTIVIDKEASMSISESLAKKHNLIPIKKEGKVLTVVMSDPLNFYAIDDVKNATCMEISVAIAPQKDINFAIDRYYGSEIAEKAFEDLQKEYGKLSMTSLSEVTENEVANAPVVRLINSLLQHAIKSSASDIHIEPTATDLKIRFRIDGQLQEVMTSSMSAHPAITTRIKIMSGMDIAEKRVPQDGRVETTVDGMDVDLRVSLLPTVYGEKIVIRVLGGQTLFQIFNRLLLKPLSRVKRFRLSLQCSVWVMGLFCLNELLSSYMAISIWIFIKIFLMIFLRFIIIVQGLDFNCYFFLVPFLKFPNRLKNCRFIFRIGKINPCPVLSADIISLVVYGYRINNVIIKVKQERQSDFIIVIYNLNRFSMSGIAITDLFVCWICRIPVCISNFSR
jgi:hypothetical protein